VAAPPGHGELAISLPAKVQGMVQQGLEVRGDFANRSGTLAITS
jgi:hypothetical protein